MGDYCIVSHSTSVLTVPVRTVLECESCMVHEGLSNGYGKKTIGSGGSYSTSRTCFILISSSWPRAIGLRSVFSINNLPLMDSHTVAGARCDQESTSENHMKKGGGRYLTH